MAVSELRWRTETNISKVIRPVAISSVVLIVTIAKCSSDRSSESRTPRALTKSRPISINKKSFN